MVIKTLKIKYVRNHEVFEGKLSPKTTVITGPNGSGKTTLLEAIYVALRGTSFRGTDKELLRATADWWRIDIGIDNAVRTVSFDSSRQTGRKKFTVDDKVFYRLPNTQKYPVVLFEPDDLRLINGSPTRRRYFIDTLTGTIQPHYAQQLRKYERALKQRNTLLKKQTVNKDDVFVWDVALAEYGAAIISQRIQLVEELNKRLSATYNSIAHSEDTVSIHYSYAASGNVKQKIMSELQANYQRDIALGYTSVGPHRHDLVFKFNESPALSVASRGEVRTIVLALKFLEVSLIEAVMKESPIVLLDDVFGELDENRQHHLASHLLNNQIIITSSTELRAASKVATITLT